MELRGPISGIHLNQTARARFVFTSTKMALITFPTFKAKSLIASSALEARLAREAAADTLLRASQSESASPETLLRPAANTETESGVLLRPANGEASRAENQSVPLSQKISE